MAKKTERRKLNDNLDDICKKIIRIRDEDTCQKCGKEVYGSVSHPSHVFSKKRHGHMRHNLLNIKLLCLGCHLHWWHLEVTESKDWFAEKFPARWTYLNEIKNKKPETIRKSDLAKLLVEMKEKLRELKGEQ